MAIIKIISFLLFGIGFTVLAVVNFKRILNFTYEDNVSFWAENQNHQKKFYLNTSLSIMVTFFLFMIGRPLVELDDKVFMVLSLVSSIINLIIIFNYRKYNFFINDFAPKMRSSEFKKTSEKITEINSILKIDSPKSPLKLLLLQHLNPKHKEPEIFKKSFESLLKEYLVGDWEVFKSFMLASENKTGQKLNWILKNNKNGINYTALAHLVQMIHPVLAISGNKRPDNIAFTDSMVFKFVSDYFNLEENLEKKFKRKFSDARGSSAEDYKEIVNFY